MTNRENPIHRIKSYLGSGSKSKWYGSETLFFRVFFVAETAFQLILGFPKYVSIFWIIKIEKKARKIVTRNCVMDIVYLTESFISRRSTDWTTNGKLALHQRLWTKFSSRMAYIWVGKNSISIPLQMGFLNEKEPRISVLWFTRIH